MKVPDLTPLKKNTAKMEKMKSTSMSSANTFINGPIDSVIVAIKAYKPLFFLASRTTRVTRSTLKSLATYGPTDRAEPPPPSLGITVNRISTKLDSTIKQSNLFQVVSKYLQLNALILKTISMKKINVKK
jgi:hypothetical protein